MNHQIDKKFWIILIALGFYSASCGKPPAPTQGSPDANSPEIRVQGVASIGAGETTLDLSSDGTKEPLPEGYTPQDFLISEEYPTAFFDLDTGTAVDIENADIYYYLSCGSQCFHNLIAIDPSRSFRISDDADHTQSCFQELNNSGLDEARPKMLEGPKTCIVTNEGRVAELVILEIRIVEGMGEITFNYKTWEN